MPNVLLRLEGAAVLVLSVGAYGVLGGGWVLFGLLLLVPDVSMAGYLKGPVWGSRLYNTAHTYVLPLGLLGCGYLFDAPRVACIALIWTAHIGLDRMLGYGLKYPTHFKHTHLGAPAGAE